MAQNEPRFVTGSTMRHVVIMTTTGSIGLMFMFLIDAATLFWVSQIGVERLVAALGFAWTIQFFTISFGLGMMIPTTALVSRALGAGDRKEARKHATSAMIITAGAQLFVAIIVVMFRHEILALSGAKGETAEIAARFLCFSVPSLPIMAFGLVGSSILRAEGDAFRAMSVTLFAGCIAMILDPLFIFTFGLGIDGAAFVIIISRSASAVLSLYYVVRIHDLAAKPSLKDIQATWRPFAIIAGPAVLTQLAAPFGNYLVTRFISEFGDSAVAGWAVIARITVLAFGGIFALSSAIGGIIGQNYGALKFERILKAYRDAMIFCFIYVLLVWLVLYASRHFIIDVFNLSGAGAEVVEAFMIWAAGGFIFTGFLFVSNAVFNNLGRPLWSTGFNWLKDAILMFPLGLLMAGWLNAPGVIYAQALSGVIAGSFAAITGWYFIKSLQPLADDAPNPIS